MTTTRTRAPARAGRSPVLVGGAVLVVVLALVAVALSRGGDGGSKAVRREVASVEVRGAALPTEGPSPDPAVGRAAPEVMGTDVTGGAVTIGGADAGPQLVFFVAHWCPHCRKEVPLVVDWLASGGGPEGVTLRAVSTGVNPAAPNYPPSAWLEAEAWPIPTLVDDATSTAATTFGLSGFPFFVAIDAEGRVVARASGELSAADLDALVQAAAA
jgi:thiol-disulfide isomerase/thioredoxin